MQARSFYEKFHSSSKAARYLIDDDNFTYWNIISLLRLIPDDLTDVLDVGCGVGTIDLYLASKNKKVLGLDISKKAVNAATISSRRMHLGDKAKFSQKDFARYSSRKRYDFIICSEVLEHLKDDDAALKKIYRLLKVNGYLVLSVPSSNSPLFRIGLLKSYDNKAGHLRRYNLRDLMRLVRKNRFLVVKTRKEEGILRNVLFTSSLGGQFLRLVNRSGLLSGIISVIDKPLKNMFGESQLCLVLRKEK